MKNVQNLLKAIEIISKNHSNEVVINKTPKNKYVGDITGGKPTLHITNCVPSVVNNLIEAGFTVDMEKGFMAVSDVFLNEEGESTRSK